MARQPFCLPAVASSRSVFSELRLFEIWRSGWRSPALFVTEDFKSLLSLHCFLAGIKYATSTGGCLSLRASRRLHAACAPARPACLPARLHRNNAIKPHTIFQHPKTLWYTVCGTYAPPFLKCLRLPTNTFFPLRCQLPQLNLSSLVGTQIKYCTYLILLFIRGILPEHPVVAAQRSQYRNCSHCCESLIHSDFGGLLSGR